MQSGKSGVEAPSPEPLAARGRGENGTGLKTIAAFAVKFFVLFGVLVASWPLCGPAYAAFLRESGKVMFEAMGVRSDRAHLGPIIPPRGIEDTVLSIRIAETGQPQARARGGSFRFSSLRVGFQPTVLLVALVFATPVEVRRRAWALLAGLIIVHVSVLARLAAYFILAPEAPRGTFWTKALGWCVFDLLWGFPVPWLVPVVIWVAVTMRSEDVLHLVASPRKKLAA